MSRIVLLACVLPACSRWTDYEIGYEDCVQPEIPYADDFGEDYQSLLDRCWQTLDGPLGEMKMDDGDLIVKPRQSGEKLLWSHNDTAPAVWRTLTGDFVLATKVEATSTTQPDHCMNGELDAAGLVVMNRDRTGAAATFLVRPFVIERPECEADGGVTGTPTGAIAEAIHYTEPNLAESDDGMSRSSTEEAGEVGEDGEANIAICRDGNDLFFFYLVPDGEREEGEGVWKLLDTSQAKGEGGATAAVEKRRINSPQVAVGLTTTSEGGSAKVEGHFNYVVVQAHGSLPGDGCSGALERMKLPKDD